ncbi:hypothetical protein FRC12_023826 [Ceratobasidium sp. 428]|nr:hypothetical protein FRC12_023826 [Ceratobasidium sp. 428]
MGPVWCYWAFPMERFCGSLARTSISSRFPYDSFAEHLLEIAQLSQIKIMYGLVETFDLEPRRHKIATGTRYGNYPEQIFVVPKKHEVPHPLLQQRIAEYLSIVLDVDASRVRRQIRDRAFDVWGKVQQALDTGPGDTIRGHAMCKESKRCTRDASYVKYWTYYDREDQTRRRPVAQQTNGYGRVEQFIVIDADFLQEFYEGECPAAPFLDPIVVAVISPIPTFTKLEDGAVIEYQLNSGKLAGPEIVDVADIRCLIGRARDHEGHRYIIDRQTLVGRLDMAEGIADRD